MKAPSQNPHTSAPRLVAAACLLILLATSIWWFFRGLGAGTTHPSNANPNSAGAAATRPATPPALDALALERAALESAMKLLMEAARTEISGKRMFALEEPLEFDIRKYSADHQLTCYLSTPNGVWMVAVTEADYPKVFDAWRNVAAVQNPSSPAVDGRTWVSTLEVAQAQAAEILLVPYPLGLPAVAYAFERQPTSEEPICAQLADERWVHSDPSGLSPEQKAWSYRPILAAEEASSDWSLRLGEGRVPDRWAIQLKVRQ